MQELRIQSEEAGSRLDRVICHHLGLSRSQARRLFEEGAVRRNGRRADKGELVCAGDQVQLGSDLADPRAAPDALVPVQLRHEDEHVLVLEKPAGVPAHPLRPGERGCVANWLRAKYPETAAFGYDLRQPGLVNRLDNDTSGLLLAARSPEAFDLLRERLERGLIEKTYLALTSCAPSRQVIDLPLAASSRHRARVEVVASGRASRTTVVRSASHGRFVLVEVRACRAYRHQVRAHLAAIGAPIVGDALYGGPPGPHHYLHAAGLRFTHPMTESAIQVFSAVPEDWPRD